MNYGWGTRKKLKNKKQMIIEISGCCSWGSCFMIEGALLVAGEAGLCGKS